MSRSMSPGVTSTIATRSRADPGGGGISAVVITELFGEEPVWVVLLRSLATLVSAL